MYIKTIGKSTMLIFFLTLSLTACLKGVRERPVKLGGVTTDTVPGTVHQMNMVVVNMNKAIQEIDSTTRRIRYQKDAVETAQGAQIDVMRQSLHDQRQKLNNEVEKIKNTPESDWATIKDESNKIFKEAKEKIEAIKVKLNKLDSI